MIWLPMRHSLDGGRQLDRQRALRVAGQRLTETLGGATEIIHPAPGRRSASLLMFRDARAGIHTVYFVRPVAQAASTTGVVRWLAWPDLAAAPPTSGDLLLPQATLFEARHLDEGGVEVRLACRDERNQDQMLTIGARPLNVPR